MSLPHWQYFLSIEEDLLRCSRYVEFEKSNFSTYSVEFARIIVAASAEFDSVAKILCKAINPGANPQSINAYHPIITSKYPRFLEYTILVPSMKLEFQPWKEWTDSAGPGWWSKGYNKIKHERDKHFAAANLENALNSVAGLLTGIAYLYDATYGEIPKLNLASAPKLLEPHDNPDAPNQSAVWWSCEVWK
ncbi:hypothetical protein [Viridibacterium curvum]|uniref:Uncharacterized protein n=1 Tax=Viridibacterium curvum TaxID=1101404 RepID=A0ABP9QHR9_9RHOO